MPKKKLKDAGNSARRQARGTYRNARGFASDTRVDDALPSGVRGFIQELFMLIPRALGRGTPRQQILSSIILGIIVVFTSPFSGFASLVLLVPLAGTLLWGVLRWVPAVNSAWQGSRVQGALEKDRDIPGWRRD